MLNSGKFSELLDPSLSNKYDHGHIERMVLAATLCIRQAPRARPRMSLVSPISTSLSELHFRLANLESKNILSIDYPAPMDVGFKAPARG